MTKLKRAAQSLQPKPVFCYCLLFFIFQSVCIVSKAQHLFYSPHHNLSVSAGAGTAKEDFRWSIAGNSNGQNPDIYSEVIYNPVYTRGFHIDASYKLLNRISVTAGFNSRNAYKGSATDFDYNGDNRTDPQTELFLKSNKGNMTRFNAGAYYHIIGSKSLSAKAGIGYRSAKELFYLLDDADPSLRSTYDARWKGPAATIDLRWTSNWKIFLSGQLTGSYLEYSSKANWNNISTFMHPVSFVQSANGTGWDYSFNIGYKLGNKINLAVEKNYSRWHTGYGSDHLFLTTGDTLVTRMNGAFKKSSGWNFNITYTF